MLPLGKLWNSLPSSSENVMLFFLLFSLVLEKLFSINIDLCPICHLVYSPFNSKFIKWI